MAQVVEGLRLTAAESEKSSVIGFSEINGDPQNVSQEAGRNDSTGASELSTHQGGNSTSISADTGISDLEQILKQKTFTRSETQRLIALLHSRTIEESPTPLLRLEASTTSGSLKRHKHGDDRVNFRASVVSSRVLEEEIVSPQHPSTIKNLPDELLINIFIRLLAKQLAQMRSVSKSWNALLSHSSFVKSHLHHSRHNNDHILLIFHYGEDSHSNFKPFTAKRSRSPHLELTNFIEVPVNPQSGHTNGIKVIGSVNGLICSSYGDSVIHIWNPSLSTVMTLPPYSTPSHYYDSISIYFRFGFDPKTDDYKVVKLTGLGGPPTYAVTWWLQVEIYSMRKGSWEVITERFPSRITDIIIDDDYVCADGHDGYIHWLCFIGEKMDSKTIVAFDLGTETFREMHLPNSTLDYTCGNILGVLAGKLCVMSCDEDVGCEVWVMEEYGVAESWVKRHVFSQFICDLNTCVFGFTSRSEFLIEDNGYLVVYDPTANEQKILENHCPEDYGATKIIEYVDSLVWIEPVEHGMVGDKTEM